MEKENKNLKIMLIIFIALSVILGGFILYDKVLKKDDAKCAKSESSCDCETVSENINDNNEDSKITLVSMYRNIKDKESYITFDSKTGVWNFYRNECHGYGTMTGTFMVENNKIILNMPYDGKAILTMSHDNYDGTLIQTDMISYGDDKSNEIVFSGCSMSRYFMSEN